MESYIEWGAIVMVGLSLLVALTTAWFIRSMVATRKVKAKIKTKQEECQHSLQQLAASLDEVKRSVLDTTTPEIQYNLCRATPFVSCKYWSLFRGCCSTEVKFMLRYFSKASDVYKMSFVELQRQLQGGSLRAEHVLYFYQSKALEKNQSFNFIVEPVSQAKELAKERDMASPKSRNEKPLHGIPISIKENYYLQGYDSTGGLSRLINKPAVEDGVLLKVLKHQGAVPFVRTNIPQSMMTFECSNPIYGTTVNPYNNERGPGGSSGGEGAILGAEASILGWGTDIGGSVRIPSHFCGVYCLKPTSGRLSLRTCEELCDVQIQTLIKATPGPMGRDVDTLVEAMKAVLCPYHFQLDPEVPPLLFNTEVYTSKRPLKIGYYINNGYVQCIPAVERGVIQAREALKKMGHELVKFEVPDVERMFAVLFCKCCFGDGGELFREMMSGDMIDSSIQLIMLLYKCPNFIQTAVSYLANWITKERVPGEQMRSMQGVRCVRDWWKLAFDLDKYKEDFMKKWQKDGLDAMLCPTMPYVAPPTGTVKYLLGGVTYTTLYNVLNFPAGCVPVTKVTPQDETNMSTYPSKTGTETFIKKYFSSDTVGLPVGVQCVGLPYQEEQVLRVMKDLENGLKQ